MRPTEKKALEIGCKCPFPRDAGKCYCDKNGLDFFAMPDFFDAHCECECHQAVCPEHEKAVERFKKDMEELRNRKKPETAS